jgi:hypothetical protein
MVTIIEIGQVLEVTKIKVETTERILFIFITSCIPVLCLNCNIVNDSITFVIIETEMQLNSWGMIAAVDHRILERVRYVHTSGIFSPPGLKLCSKEQVITDACTPFASRTINFQIHRS